MIRQGNSGQKGLKFIIDTYEAVKEEKNVTPPKMQHFCVNVIT